MSKHKKIKVVRLYFGKQDHTYQTTGNGEIVIVLVIDDSNVITDEFYRFNGKSFYIICRLWKIPPVEGIKVTKFEIGKILDNNVLTTIEKCIGNRSKSLFKRHSNLEIITMCAFRSRNNGDDLIDEPCIVFYCSCKGVVPINEETFPKHLDDIPTDVREGFFYQFPGFLRGSTEVLDPLRMGAIISRKDQPSNGTLGGFVTMGSGDIGFITAAHVFKTVSGYFTSDDNFDVVQPSRGFFRTNVCGVNAKSFVSAGLFDGHTIDAALVRITSRKPTRGLFAGMNEQQLKESGYSLEMLPEYDNAAIRDFRQEQTNRWNTCVKFGASTGLTRGTLCLNGICVKWTDDFITLGNLNSVCDILYFKQLQIQGHQNLSFAQPGDSGALVFQVDSDDTNGQRLVCIGMVVGGTSDNKTVVTPIVPILNALKVQMHQFNTINMDES
ncbi:uncharacterized protein LOC134264521 [Saccostrea cucullata]|uniref:uncharacterized protein LOC134264521 n=1 Tax=Saccostrea cuccullata TaxID=36930 RepID=UPI002ED4D1A6